MESFMIFNASVNNKLVRTTTPNRNNPDRNFYLSCGVSQEYFEKTYVCEATFFWDMISC
jgi:hypothetical protein